MELLREVLNTIYLTKDYRVELEYLLSHVASGRKCTEDIYAQGVKDAVNRAVDAGRIEIDLADCRFVTEIMDLLFIYAGNYPDKIILSDTADQERNRFLETRRYEQTHKNEPNQLLPPKPASMEEFVAWASQLNPSIIYDAHEYDKHPEFLIFLQLLRPEIKIIASYTSMFKYAKDVFSVVLLYESREFLYIPSNVDEFWDTRVDENDMVHVVNVGDITRKEFVAKYLCMPAEIGQKQFTSAASQDWKDCVRRVILDVTSYLADRPTTIATYFPEEFQ